MRLHPVNESFGHLVEIGWDASAQSFVLEVTNGIDGRKVRPWENEPPVQDVDEALGKLVPYGRPDDPENFRATLSIDQTLGREISSFAELAGQTVEQPDRGLGQELER